MEALHKAGVVFRDLKPTNLLFSNIGRIKIVDFKCSLTIEEIMTNSGTKMGSIHYSPYISD